MYSAVGAGRVGDLQAPNQLLQAADGVVGSAELQQQVDGDEVGDLRLALPLRFARQRQVDAGQRQRRPHDAALFVEQHDAAQRREVLLLGQAQRRAHRPLGLEMRPGRLEGGRDQLLQPLLGRLPRAQQELLAFAGEGGVGGGAALPQLAPAERGQDGQRHEERRQRGDVQGTEAGARGGHRGRSEARILPRRRAARRVLPAVHWIVKE